MNVDLKQLAKAGAVVAACAALYHFVKHPVVRTAAVAVGAGVVVKNTPIVNELV